MSLSLAGEVGFPQVLTELKTGKHKLALIIEDHRLQGDQEAERVPGHLRHRQTLRGFSLEESFTYGLISSMSSHDRVDELPATDVLLDTIIHDPPPQDGSSDGEGGERTAREKLKKTSIAGLSQYSKVGKTTGDQPLGEVLNADTVSDAIPENGQARGRPSKKRSFDDLQNEETGASVENGAPPLPKKGTQHKRMRSRELSGDEQARTLDQNENMASPVQEESGADAQQSPGGPGVLVSAPSQAETEEAATNTALDEEDTTAGDTPPNITSGSDQKSTASETGVNPAPSTEQETKPQILASSGFANASTASPFRSFKSPKSPDKSAESATSIGTATTTSAFASSGLSAFASSEKSPFGAVGATAKSSGGFGGGTSSGGFGSSSGGFGGSSTSTFASKSSSGFGSGGGFGSAGGFGGGGGFGAAVKPFGGGLSSFAGGAGTGAAPFTKAKPLGVKSDEEEEGSDEGGDEEEGAQQAEKDASRDPRFHQQERTPTITSHTTGKRELIKSTVNTGEEDEETIFSCTAKLYHFEKEWKESGVGDFKINIRYEAKSNPSQSARDDTDPAAEHNEQDLESGQSETSNGLERKARLIMRARGTHRLVLNTPVFKEMNVGTHDGKEPTGKTMHITGLAEGKPTGYQMKVSNSIRNILSVI